jgi:hypothetical protein
VQAASAANPANYAIGGGVAVLASAVSADNRSVLLTTTALAPNQTYEVSAANIVATSGRTIAPNSSVALVMSNVRQDFSVRHVHKAGGPVGTLSTPTRCSRCPRKSGIASQAMVLSDGQFPRR